MQCLAFRLHCLRRRVLLLFSSSPILYSYPKFKAVDEQTDDEIVDLRGLRETDGSSGQALEPRAQRQMFALNLLGIMFANFMDLGIQMPPVRSPAIGVKVPYPKRHEQRFQLPKRLIFPPPEHVS